GRMKQIDPPSITGKGSRFADGGSVLDHAFGKSDAYTLGVEEEYMLLDAETFDLVQHIDTVLADVSGHELEPRINAELMQSVLEVATPVCHTPSDVETQLRALRGYVTQVARARGMRGGSAGTALEGLRRQCGGRRPTRAHRLHRRLHAHLVGHPSAPAARHDRDPDLRRGHRPRRRDRDHRVLPGARQALLRAVRCRHGDP